MPNNIKKAREKAGYSQKQVALQLHVSAPTVSDWESGKTNPNTTNLRELSSFLNVSIDYLLDLPPKYLEENLLSAYIKNRRKNTLHKSVSDLVYSAIKKQDSFYPSEILIPKEDSQYYIELIEQIEGDTIQDVDCKSLKSKCISTKALDAIAFILDVQPQYLYCLQDKVNPHRVNDVLVPNDDITAAKGYKLYNNITLSLFNSSAPSDISFLSEDALEVARAYSQLSADKKNMVRRLLDLEPLADSSPSANKLA